MELNLSTIKQLPPHQNQLPSQQQPSTWSRSHCPNTFRFN